MNINNKSIVFPTLLATFLFFFSIIPTHATVGGPTYIGNFKYNKVDESIYFVAVSQSGRGCPPVLNKISLTNEQISSVISCDQGEGLLRTQGGLSDYSPIYEEIAAITESAKILTSISLVKNNIEVDVEFVNEEKLPEDDYVIKNHFVANIYQSGTKIDEFPISGCSLDQPFTFAGYAIPGFEQKMIIVSSAKSDCFEGGYIGENIHVINGVKNLDKTQIGEWKGENSPLVPNEGTRVVFEKDLIIQTPSSPSTTSPSETNESDDGRNLLITILVLVIGVVIGYFLRRK